VIPDDPAENAEIARKLGEKYQISLLEYSRSLDVNTDET